MQISLGVIILPSGQGGRDNGRFNWKIYVHSAC